jgi:hypothetical protein
MIMKILLLFLLTFTAFALEIDEKLTARLLEVSRSKKTVLINRGLEDGLVVGNHAKFFLTSGVIARGVVIKASPSRSIWSVYRLVSPDAVLKSKVLNLKIASPVRLTEDSSKSIRALVVNKDFGEPVDVAMTSTTDTMNIDSMDDNSEISALMGEGGGGSVAELRAQDLSMSRSKLTLEAWGLMSMNSLSGTYTANNTSVDTSRSSFSLTGGFEKYFASATSSFKNVSLKVLMSKQTETYGNDNSSEIDQLDIGGGLAYYFGRGPFMNNSFMFFADAIFGISSITMTSGTESLEGAGSFLSIGVGTKYMFNGSFGVLGRADYYSSTTTFDIDEGTGSIVTNELAVSGPRLLFGAFWRFL